MSKIDELIKERCPNGVKYKTLGELGKFYGGLTGKSKDDFRDGNAIFITYKNVYSNPALEIFPEDRVKISDGEKQHTLQYGDIIFTGSSETPQECGFSSVVTSKPEEKLYLNSFCFFFRLDDVSAFYPDFTKHLFRSSTLRRQIIKTASGVTRFNVSKKLMEKVKVPIIPIEIQKEIAGMLNSMSELEAELEAELTKRKQQYEHYRDHLLSFENIAGEGGQVEWLALEEIAKIKNGSGYKEFGDGPYPVYGTGGIMTRVDRYAYDKPSVLIPRKGSLDRVYFVEEPFWNVDTIFYTEIDEQKIIPKYFYYFLSNKHLEELNQAAGVPSLTQTVLNKIKVPVPSLKVQERIVYVLDNFDAVCNDLNIGLPAEIEARQKQYEYYRDRLLSFDTVVGGDIEREREREE